MSISPELRQKVIERDARIIYYWSEENIHHHVSFRKFMARKRPICLMELFDKKEAAKCSGRTTLDHVKDEPMMGKKAPDDEWHLTAVCFYHNAYSPPSKAFRAFQRRYLADARRAASLETERSDQPEVEEDGEPRRTAVG
jgi:hypothetical protein